MYRLELERFGEASRVSFKHPYLFNFIRLTLNPRNSRKTQCQYAEWVRKPRVVE